MMELQVKAIKYKKEFDPEEKNQEEVKEIER